MKEKIKLEIIEWSKSIVFSVVIVAILNIFIASTMVYSISMNPTLVEKDLLILKRTKNVEIGDIVSFKSELRITESDLDDLNIIQKIKTSAGDRKNLIKRVIGVPGDKLEIKDNLVYINDELLEEDYINNPTDGNVYIEVIPKGKYFLMGDNRNYSLDSRSDRVGLVDEEEIIGSVMIRVYPFNRISYMK